MDLETISLFTSLILTVLLVPLGALMLKFTAKILKLEDTSYSTAFKISFILGLFWLMMPLLSYFMPSLIITLYLIFSVIYIMLGIWLIKTNYNTETGRAILVIMVWSILTFIMGILSFLVLTFIIGLIGLKLLFGG